jgi:tRNA threonylcarbamoyladenosine biosynthesis protein TsaE
VIRLSSSSADDTRAIAAAIAGVLEPGDVVVLDGGLGAGKTTFVQGAVAGLGSAAAVTSPTFAIVQQYRGGPTEIAHVDAYRLDRVQELHDIGFDELLDGTTIVFVEWGERVRAMLPDDRVTVTLTMAYERGAPADARTLVVEHLGESWSPRAAALHAALSRYEARD